MISWVLCKIGFHKYYQIKSYSHTTRKVGCRKCRLVWGMNDSVKALVPWDEELEAIHEGEFRP